MPLNVFKRYERKFILTEKQFERFLPAVEKYLVLDPYCSGRTPYHLRNLYYDTADRHLISHSVRGPTFQQKIRIRKYGTYGDGQKNVYLEIKGKTTQVVTKRRTLVTEEEAYDFLERKIPPKGRDILAKQIVAEMVYFLDLYPLKKSMFIAYDRLAYFAKNDPEFRITFDTNITAHENDFSFEKPKKGVKLLAPGTVLLEVKFAHAVPLWFARILSEQKVFMGRYSKYGKAYAAKILKEM